MLGCTFAALVALVAPVHAASIAAPAVAAGPDAGAATPDPAAITYNPGALAATEGAHVLFDGQASFIGITATATRNGGIDPNTGVAYEPLDADVMVPVFLLGATWKVIPDRLAVGLAVNDPFVGGGKYLTPDGEPDKQAHGRYHGISVEILTIAVTPAVSVTTIDGLHVGGGASYVIDHIKALQAADPFGTEGIPVDQVGTVPPADPYSTDVYLDAEGSGHHWGWNAGVFFDRYEKLQIGASYASGGTFRAEGTANVEVPATISTTAEAITVPGNVSFTLYTPPIARLHVASQVNERLWLGAGVDYEMWNVCCGTAEGDLLVQLTNDAGEAIGPDDGVSVEIAKDQYNPSRLWNAASVQAYGGFQVNEKLWFGGRVGYNQNAVPDYAVSPVNLDFENVGAQAAARYKLGKVLTLGLSYGHFFLFTREITDSAWDRRDGNARFSPALPYKSNANGTYSGGVNTVGLRVGADF